MLHRQKLVVEPSDQPCFGAIQSLASAAAENRRRIFILIFGSLPAGRTAQACGIVFSTKCLWLSQDGIYIFLPGQLPTITGFRWVAFSKTPLVRSGMTAEALALIRYVRFHWSSRRSAWLVTFLYPGLPVAAKRTKMYFPED